MILFSHIPKTAGTTFKNILYTNFGMHIADGNKTKKAIFEAKDLAFALRIFPGLKAVSGHNLSDPVKNLDVHGAELITILRQPNIRCASHYQDNVLRGELKLSFAEWIAIEKHQNLMVRSIAGAADLQKAKLILKEDYLFVGFTEKFNESLQLLNTQLKKPLTLQFRIKIIAKSNKIKQELLADQETLRLLEKHNSLDQQLYEYAMQEIYLPMLDNFGSSIDPDMTLPEKLGLGSRIRSFTGFRYNKFVYRQLIKLKGVS